MFSDIEKQELKNWWLNNKNRPLPKFEAKYDDFDGIEKVGKFVDYGFIQKEMVLAAKTNYEQ